MNKKKHQVGQLFHLLILMLMIAAVLPANAETYQDFEFTVFDREVTIDKYTGKGGEVVIPSKIGKYKVISIGTGAFEGHKNITSVVIPSGIVTLSHAAFSGCPSLKQIILPNTLKDIGKFAFYNNSKIEGITIPASVKNIGENAFGLCASLKSINVETKNKSYKSIDGVLYDKAGETLIAVPSGIGLEKFDVPTGVTKVASGAFDNCATLKDVSIPFSVIEIGTRAFVDCKKLESIVLPEGLKTIEWGLFTNCVALRDVKIPSSVISIGGAAFQNCHAIKDMIIPEGVTRIEPVAFDTCKSLETVSLPSSLTFLGDNAFYGCNKLTRIELPIGITEIRWRTFTGCSQLREVVIPDSVTSIGEYAFEECRYLSEVLIPGSVTSIEASAFPRSTKVKGYEGTYAQEFAKKGSRFFEILETPPLRILEIRSPQEKAAVGQTLTWSILATGGAGKKEYLFIIYRENEQMETFPVSQEATVSYIPRKPGEYQATAYVFSGELTASLPGSRILVTPQDPKKEFTYKTSGKKVTITGYRGSGPSVLVPDTIAGYPVTAIADRAFESQGGVTSVILPDTITSIGNYAFFQCRNLRSINFPLSLKVVGKRAFADAPLTGNFILPPTMERIGFQAFAGCDGLVSLLIPDSVTEIGREAFPPATYLQVTEGSVAHQYAKAGKLPFSFEQVSLDASGVKNTQDKAAWVVRNYTNETMGEYDKALALHDWLVFNVEYIYNEMWNMDNYTAEQVLLHGTGVCNGYALAYEMLLNAAGIENKFVHGVAKSGPLGDAATHAWNLVRMEGDWYHVDCTWDDSIREGRDYFGLTDDAIGVSHFEYDTDGITCTAYRCNYEYRSGALDKLLDQAKKDIQSGLKKSGKFFEIRMTPESSHQRMTGLTVLAALRDWVTSLGTAADKLTITLQDWNGSTFIYRIDTGN